MVAEELNTAMAAYNLVRTITCIAAERAGIPPRGYSFTRLRNVVEALTPLIASARATSSVRRRHLLAHECQVAPDGLDLPRRPVPHLE